MIYLQFKCNPKFWLLIFLNNALKTNTHFLRSFHYLYDCTLSYIVSILNCFVTFDYLLRHFKCLIPNVKLILLNLIKKYNIN